MEDEYAFCPWCGLESHVGDYMSNHGRCPYCSKPNPDLGEESPYDRYGSRRTAATCATCGDLVGQEDYDDSWHHLDDGGHPDHFRDDDHPVEPEFDETDDWNCPNCGAGNVEQSCHNCGSRNFEASKGRTTMYRHAAPDDNSSFDEAPSKNQSPADPSSVAPSLKDFMSDGNGRDTKSIQMPSPAPSGSKLFGPGGQGSPGGLGIGGNPSSGLVDFSGYDNEIAPAQTPAPGAGWSNLAPSAGDPNVAGQAGYASGKANYVAPVGQERGAMRIAAIDFLAGQNVTDREELLFRAHRHASEQTCRLPVPVAQRVVQQFVSAVNQEIAATPKPRRQASRRTAAVVADFPDELMF